MNNLSFASIKELKELLAKGEITSSELLQHFIKRFETHDAQLGSALEIFQADSVIKASSDKGVLAGIPGLIKDNISQKGRKVSCASKILEGFEGMFDATIVQRLKQEGALLMGRANMDEFAMGSSNETSAYKKAKNPWDTSRVPGGSSGGSAAAVAAGLAPWALGSDTGGSIRQPAAFCGIVGMKPTYGLVSRYGLVAYASSLDQIGPMTRTVYDNALVMSVLAGNDPKDSTTLAVGQQDYTANLTGKIKPGLRIGVVENAIGAQGMDAEVVQKTEEAIKVFEKLGATIVRLSVPAMDYSAAAYFVVSRAEAASNLARFDGVRYGMRTQDADTLSDLYTNTRHDGFGKEVRARIMVGNYVLSAGYASAYYANAKRVQQVLRQEFEESFKKVDILLVPTQPAPAFKLGAFDVDPLQMDLQDYFTCPMNLAGIPAISIPCGVVNNLPIGLQLAGPHLSEALLYQTAFAYEENTEWNKVHPQGF